MTHISQKSCKNITFFLTFFLLLFSVNSFSNYSDNPESAPYNNYKQTNLLHLASHPGVDTPSQGKTKARSICH